MIRRLLSKLKEEILRRFRNEYVPAGHYYSAIPNLKEIALKQENIFSKSKEINDILLNSVEQIDTLDRFTKLKEIDPFYSDDRRNRFNIENNSFSYDDAPVLHYMIRDLKPKRIIEIGSGNSSACM